MQHTNSRAFLISLLALVLSFALTTPLRAEPAQWKAEGWRTDFSTLSVPVEEILSGGPPKDGIPPIDNPKFAGLAAAGDLAPNEAVIGLTIAGRSRAYPLRVLMWHEIVNDELGGVPVAVTYCPLCNAAIVFERRIGSRTLSFGTTGKLRNSDLIMYDRQSESWWQQFTGEAIAGELAGQRLRMLPARLESFGEFRAREPSGEVLIPADSSVRPYGRNPYAGYDSAAAPFLYSGELPKDVPAMARVVVVESAAKPMAVTLDLLRKKGRMMLGDVELSWRAGQASAVDADTVAGGRDVGTVAAQRAGRGGGMEDVRYDVTFAFVFHAFHKPASIIRE